MYKAGVPAPNAGYPVEPHQFEFAAAGAWLVARAHQVPDALKARGVAFVGIWISPSELASLGRSDGHDLPRPADDGLAALVSAGHSAAEIAAALHVSHRTAQRRIAALRHRHGAGSRAELVAILARGGA